MVLRNARGPQHHPSREHLSCQKPHPTPAPHKHPLLLLTEGSEHFFCEGLGERGWGAYLFSKLDKWRRGERIKLEAETIVSNMWHDDWLLN